MQGPRSRLLPLLLFLLGGVSACGTDPCTDCDALHLQVRGTVRDSTGAAAPGLHATALLTRYDTLVPTLIITSGTGTTTTNGSYVILLTTTQADLELDSRPLLVRVQLREDPADSTPFEEDETWPVMPGPVSAPAPPVVLDFVVPIP